MKTRLLQYIVCPACEVALALATITLSEGEEIMEGELQCRSCRATFPIVGGIPRFATPERIHAEKAATAASFGWQWQHFAQQDDRYEEQFLGWIAPIKPEFFRDKVVLEGGCGKGRHTQLAASWGARDVIGVDLSDAVETAFAATREIENAHIIQADIYNLPFARIFDYAFSVGVLHHLPDPLRKGVTSRIAPRALLQLSKLPAALLYLTTKLIYRPLNRFANGAIAQHLFYNDYLNAIASFGWGEQHTIVFDHLVAPTSFYISREEFEEWWRQIGARDVVIGWHNKNSWRGFARVP